MASNARRLRKISPLGFRVLVQIQKNENQTEGGLYLPEGAKDSMAESITGTVIEVAVATDDIGDTETNVSGIPLGATVLIKKDVGVKVPWDENTRIIETQDILALVDEVSIS